MNADPRLGPGGAPTRCTTLPESAAERKQYPIASGVLDYFPDAIAAIARLSWQGNEQHNPGEPLHWARSKSGDEADTMLRHFLQRGALDTDGIRHSAKMAWRALALLQKEIETEQAERATQEKITLVKGLMDKAADNLLTAESHLNTTQDCGTMSPRGYFCTRPAGHAGDHEAGGVYPSQRLYDRWP